MSRWAVRHPIAGLLTWVALAIVILGGAATFSGTLVDSFSLPNTPSQQAQDLLQELAPKDAEPTTTATIVWKANAGTATDDSTKAVVLPLLTQLAQLPKVQCITSPLGENLGPDCTKASPVGLEQVVTDKAYDELAKATKLTPAQLREVTRLLPRLAPLEKANAAELGKLAAALPGIAKIAQLPKPLLDGLASITAADYEKIPGLTRKEADDLVAAFGALDKVAKLPKATLATFAKANPTTLRDAAEKIPASVTKLEKGWATFQADLARLQDAARATQAATSTVSADGRIAYATLTISGSALNKDEAAQAADLIAQASTPAVTIGAQSGALEGAGISVPPSDLIGIGVAFIILLVAFGSVIAAGLPLVVAILGFVVGEGLLLIVARFMNVATFAPELAAMIGLGVGIDYALFIMSRYRQGVHEGLAPKDAAERAVGTAGRAVLFAGCTVIVALLGMFALRISFFNGLGVGAAVTVLMVMTSALLLLPSLLSLLGTKALALKLPWARHPKPFDPETSRWSGYGRLLQKAPAVPFVLALVLIGLLAWPALRLQLGFPDDSSQDAVGTPLRTGYSLMAEGFGPGTSGPFFVAVQTTKKGDFDELGQAITALEQTPGVARVLPNSAMLPLYRLDPKSFGGPEGTLTSVIVYPTTGSQDPATSSTLDRIRSTTAPQLKSADGIGIYVGGTQAVSTDFTTVLNAALPLFLLIVVGLGFLALMLLFHSLLIPLTGALTSLLSFAGALGVTVGVFQLGWLAPILGVPGTGPILPFLPIMVFAILFGLSMDYQVFLVSRMKEEWDRTHDNRDAVRVGLAGSGRVVVAAALIMTSVFLAFVPTPITAIKLFGVALASAVLIDAFIVRLLLIPSLMSLLGRANWWMPRWLGRILPTIHLE